jgi:hypothetical protein
MLDPDKIGQLSSDPDFWEAMDAFGETPFYPPADFSSVR